MEILKFLNPIHILNMLWSIFKELDNYIFYIKQVTQMKEHGKNAFYKIKIDKLYRLYTFINLPPELLMTETDLELERYEKEVVGAFLTGKFQKLIVDYNLYDLIKYRYKRIKTTDIYGYEVYATFNFLNVKIFPIIWISIYVFLFYKLVSLIPINKIVELIN